MKLISFDVETSGVWRDYGLQPYRAVTDQAWLTSFAYAIPSPAGCITGGALNPSVTQLKLFLETCARHNTRIVGWNTCFDIAWLIALGLRQQVYANKWLDGMLLWRHLTISPDAVKTHPPSYGLKAAVAEHYPKHAGYGDGIDFSADDLHSLQLLLAYNKKDAEFTLDLAQLFLSRMPPTMRRAAMIEAACLPLVAESYITGLTINAPAAHALDAQLNEDHTVAFVKLKLSGAGVTPEVLASPAQLGTLMYEHWGLLPPHLTPGGGFSTDKEALQILAVTDERAGWVRDYREAFTNQTKFVHSTLESIKYNGDGCTRPQARVYGTYTGRMTYYSKQGKGAQEVQTGVALHQWKRGKLFRELIAVPEGFELLEFDFAGQEFRWMACEANDPTMLAMCEPGADAHSFMGAQIRQRDYHEMIAAVAAGDELAAQDRYLGKFVNLSAQYRTSAPTLKRMAAIQYGVDISLEQAEHIHSTYRRTYRQVPQYWKRAIYAAKKHGYAETPAGRRVQLLQGEYWTPQTRWAIESTAINFPIQGAGADQKYLALLVLKDALPTYNAKFYFELHDGLFVIAPKDRAQSAAHKIRHLLSNLPYKKAWGETPACLFPVDAKRGTTWGNLEKLHAQ